MDKLKRYWKMILGYLSGLAMLVTGAWASAEWVGVKYSGYMRVSDAALTDLPAKLDKLETAHSDLAARLAGHGAALILIEPEMDAFRAGQDRLFDQMTQMVDQAAQDRARLATQEDIKVVREGLVDAAIARQISQLNAKRLDANSERLGEIADSVNEIRMLLLVQQRERNLSAASADGR